MDMENKLTKLRDLRMALEEIARLNYCQEPPAMLRLEDDA